MKMNGIRRVVILGTLFASSGALAYHTANGKIYTEQGEEVVINGVSWSGLQDDSKLNGLAGNPFYQVLLGPQTQGKLGMMETLTHPWDYPETGITKEQGVQFKTIRLPIQPAVIADPDDSPYVVPANFQGNYADKNHPQQGSGVFCKTWQQDGVHCAVQMNNREMFWQTLEEFKKNNIRVLIDFHHHRALGDQRDGKVYDLSQYQQDVATLAREIKARNLSNVLGIDIYNEPYKLWWFKDRGSVEEGYAAWGKVIAVAAKAVYENNPDLLLFVEGTDTGSSGDPALHSSDGLKICVAGEVPVDPNGYSISTDPACVDGQRVDFKANWGEDFRPLLDKRKALQGIASFDRAGFSQYLTTTLTQTGTSTERAQAIIHWLLGEADASQSHLVISPHVYPKQIGGWETAPGKPSQLRFDWNWGFLGKAGYPVVLGEAAWNRNGGVDFVTKTLLPYMKTIGSSASNYFYWAIGYLGDTTSLIGMSDGKLDPGVYAELHKVFAPATPSGELELRFNSSGELSGSLEIKLNGQPYECSLSKGCQISLTPGEYSLTATPAYQIDRGKKQIIELTVSPSGSQVDIVKDRVTEHSLDLLVAPSQDLKPVSYSYKLNFVDEQGSGVDTGVKQPLTLELSSKAEPSNHYSCVVAKGADSCQTQLYNMNLDPSSGKLKAEDFELNLPETLNANDDNSYQLQAVQSDLSLELQPATTGSISQQGIYQYSAAPPVTDGSVTPVSGGGWADIQQWKLTLNSESLKEKPSIELHIVATFDGAVTGCWSHFGGAVSFSGSQCTIEGTYWSNSEAALGVQAKGKLTALTVNGKPFTINPGV
ncbi:cellulase family glycosylhydrolase [Dongshaea marina]|uniref:cellulase family glycosylhydrolase n=1 Tax=Dongshaea marina TaxID=2047966 RepID=UPI001900C7E6|nr:cellulase family glycosylhydrolase [Dongshaea marina]